MAARQYPASVNGWRRTQADGHHVVYGVDEHPRHRGWAVRIGVRSLPRGRGLGIQLGAQQTPLDRAATPPRTQWLRSRYEKPEQAAQAVLAFCREYPPAQFDLGKLLGFDPQAGDPVDASHIGRPVDREPAGESSRRRERAGGGPRDDWLTRLTRRRGGRR
jgi:hypothetical protein